MKKYDDIDDNQIRLIGGEQYQQPKRKWWLWGLVAVAILATVLTITLVRRNAASQTDNVAGVFEPETTAKVHTHPLRSWLQAQDTVTQSGCALTDTTINDIAIRIYLPLNARPALEIGMRPLYDNDVILAFQAADIRADNQKIVGAFVEKGKPIAWGLSKKGYCAIIPNTRDTSTQASKYSVYVGMADNSPLFEEATECGGYFFRQYPLVADYQPQESELKSQSLRRALCEVDEHICVVETQEKASMHDFAVLLADLGVKNAIYLIGGDAMATVTELNGTRTQLGKLLEEPYKYTNFVFWTKLSPISH